LLLTTFLGAFASPASAQFALHSGDRVVFYGDSITDNAPYGTFIENFVLTRFPRMNVRFFNAGVGGDRVSGGGLGPIDTRLDRDVFSRQPTVVTVMLGMNDGNYQAFSQGTLDVYKKGLAHIADRFRVEIPHARVWMIEPSPFDDITRPYSGYNDVLVKFGSAVAELANERGYGVIPMNEPVAEAIRRAVAVDPALAQKILPDRVHPWLGGHLVMGATILHAWGAPNLVSRTDINAHTGKAIGDGAVIRNVQTGPAVRWSSTEDSLPCPFDHKDPVTNLILRSSPIEDLIGREVILVHGLAPGMYKLTIDGKEVARFSADTFDTGVDLSWLDTPMTQQAQRVADLTAQRVAMKYFAWRTIEVALVALPQRSRAEAVRALDHLEDDLIARQHAEALPKPHIFEVAPA
jgi:lysophospholipase L1-like esterase